MSELASEAMESEFGTVAGWTEEAARALGPEHAVPAGCRGSGSEGALRWLADALEVRAGDRVLDSGAGVGGPAGGPGAGGGVPPGGAGADGRRGARQPRPVRAALAGGAVAGAAVPRRLLRRGLVP